MDLNFQASRDGDLISRVLLYNALLHHRYRVPVHSMLVLLREAADSPDLSGKHGYRVQAKGRLQFGYEVVRLWRQPVRRFLKGGLGALPLAMLAKLPERAAPQAALAAVVQQMGVRLEHESPRAEASQLLTSAFILSGLRLPRETAVEVFKGAIAMEESTTYQYILEKGLEKGIEQGLQLGKVKEARKIIARQGTIRFGEPDDVTKARLDQIESLDRLERLSDRVITVGSWQELLATSSES